MMENLIEINSIITSPSFQKDNVVEIEIFNNDLNS